MIRILSSLLLWCALAIAQSGDANVLFQKQDWAAAAPLFEAAVKANPSDGLSWFRLGTCLHRLNRNQESRQAFHKALALHFQPLQAMVTISRSHFKDGDDQDGVAWLQKAVDAGFANTAFLDSDPDMIKVKDVPEVANLRPRIEQNAHPCQLRPEYHEFDFWVGEWDVMSPGAAGPAQSRIEKIMDGCIVQENWMPPGFPGGKSWNFYNPATHKWEQVWVAPAGISKYEGRFRDGAMRFEGHTPQSSGPERLDRLTFTPMPDGKVRQFWEQSSDGGKTWSVAFDGIYTRREARL